MDGVFSEAGRAPTGAETDGLAEIHSCAPPVGGERRVIAFITDPPTVRTILLQPTRPRPPPGTPERCSSGLSASKGRCTDPRTWGDAGAFRRPWKRPPFAAPAGRSAPPYLGMSGP